MTIQFKKHFVKNTETGAKCRVYYSRFACQDGRNCVTLYAKGYNDRLFPVIGALTENDSDMMTDYFEKDRARIYEDNPLYAAACEACA